MGTSLLHGDLGKINIGLTFPDTDDKRVILFIFQLAGQHHHQDFGTLKSSKGLSASCRFCSTHSSHNALESEKGAIFYGKSNRLPQSVKSMIFGDFY